jgi:plastocyanin
MSNRSRYLPTLGLVALSLATVGCGSSSSHSSTAAKPAVSASAPASAAAHSAKVSIHMFGFHPADLTVSVGARITFTNEDQTAHTATATDTAFDTGTIQPGQSRTITVTRAGVFPYYCQFHAFMRGQITVMK